MRIDPHPDNARGADMGIFAVLGKLAKDASSRCSPASVEHPTKWAIGVHTEPGPAPRLHRIHLQGRSNLTGNAHACTHIRIPPCRGSSSSSSSRPHRAGLRTLTCCRRLRAQCSSGLAATWMRSCAEAHCRTGRPASSARLTRRGGSCSRWRCGLSSRGWRRRGCLRVARLSGPWASCCHGSFGWMHSEAGVCGQHTARFRGTFEWAG